MRFLQYGLLPVLVLCFPFFSNLYSQDHPVAIAYPMPAVTIDGNLQDWPTPANSYAIAQLAFGSLENENDLSASFQIGYNLEQELLYVAVSVTDSDYVPTNAQNANATDRLLLYIDPVHSKKGGSSVIFEGGEHFKDITDNPQAWNPLIPRLSWEDVNLAVQRQENVTTYEWAISLGETLTTNTVLGFDLIVADADTGEDEVWMLWKPGTGKSRSAWRLGEVILAEDVGSLGTLKGQVVAQDTLISELSEVVLRANTNPLLWFRASVDSLGNYMATVPSTTYDITYGSGYTSARYSAGYHKSRKVVASAADKVAVLAEKTQQAPELRLNTAPFPEGLVEKKGVLFKDDFDAARLDQFIKTYQTYFNIPGVSVAVIKDNKVVYRSTHGLKNATTGETLEENHLFEAASITKSVFAVIALKLVEEGILDLDKPLYEYLAFPNIEHDERHKQITARHVLNHQSGLENWPVGSYTGNLPPVEATLHFDPGTAYRYSGEAMNYLGRVIEKLTGKSLTDLFNERIAANFGLERTFFCYTDDQEMVTTLGHYHDHPNFKNKFPGVDSPASSLVTEAGDFSNFMLGLLDEAYLSKESYQLLYEPFTVLKEEEVMYDPEYRQYLAHGFFVTELPEGKVIGHGGNNGDFDCKYGIMPGKGLGYAVFTNNNMGDEFVRLLEEYLLIGTKETQH